MCRDHQLPKPAGRIQQATSQIPEPSGQTRDSPGTTRRTVLRGLTLTAGGIASAGLAAMVAAPVAQARTVTRAGSVTHTFTGRSPFGIDQWAYVPFEVPPGVRRVSVSYSYDEFVLVPGVAANVLDIGAFGPAGWDLGNGAGFRGWSGGARDAFTVSASDATPGYLPGPIEAGTWAIALGPIVVNPAGMGWRVNVTLEYGEDGEPFRPAPAPTSARGRGRSWYRGDMHLHTVHSDGRRTPEQLVAAARRSGLDFIASTEHNTRSAGQVWGRYAPDDLLIINGEEVTTRHGHWLAIGLPPDRWIDWRYGPGADAFAKYTAQVRRAGGIVVAAHPAVPVPATAWEFGYEHVDAIEVWNGPWTPDDQIAVGIWDGLLRAGGRQVAVGDSDSHDESQVVGLPQTVVHAGDLSTAEILSAVRRGRSYLAESSKVSLRLTARAADRTAGPGQTLAAGDDPVVVTATVTGVPHSLITLHTARGQVAVGLVPASGTGELRWRTSGTTAARFVRAEVRHLDVAGAGFTSMAALSNPVWLER